MPTRGAGEEAEPLTGPAGGGGDGARGAGARASGAWGVPGAARAAVAAVAGRGAAARTCLVCVVLFGGLLLLPGLLGRLGGAGGQGAPAAALAPAPASAVHGAHGAVAADDARCSKLGVHVLSKLHGSAADAAVAALLCQGAVAPFGSGVGGGALIVATAGAQQAQPPVFIDARETAPAGTDPAGYEADAARSTAGGAAVAVPGEIAGLFRLHQAFGRLQWKEVVELAVPLAEENVVSDTFARYIRKYEPVVRASADLTALLRRDRASPEKARHAAAAAAAAAELPGVRRGAAGGAATPAPPALLRAGDKYRNPALAATLRRVAAEGPSALYVGLAKNISQVVQAAGGALSAADLGGYRAFVREPVRTTYRRFTVLGAGLPSAGGASVAMALNILESVNLARRGRNRVTYAYVVEAMKYVFGMRMRLGDPRFASGARRTARQMLDKALAHRLARRIDVSRTFPPSHYARHLRFAPDDHGTTHVSVVDADGAAVAATSTINIGFGAGVVAAGVLLNNEMDDFSTSQQRANYFGLYPSLANKIQPGKRPLSSMSPTIVLRAGGSPFLVLGGSGGPRIISAALLTMINVLDWGDAVSEAVAAPRLHHQLIPNQVYMESVNKTTCGLVKESGPAAAEKAQNAAWKYWPNVCSALKGAGHKIYGPSQVGNVQAVLVAAQSGAGGKGGRQVYAASDPRKGSRAAAY